MLSPALHVARRWAAPAALGLLLAACGGDIVETGAGAEAGKGFADVTVTTPSTEPSPTDPTATTSSPTSAPAGTAPPTTAPRSTDPSATTTAPADAGGGDLAAGDCVTWDQSGATAGFLVVPCDQEHLIEIAGAGDLGDQFGPDAPYPPMEALQAAVAAVCEPIVVDYVANASPDEIEAGVIPPSEVSWAQGDRTVWCTVGRARQDGQRVPYTGRIGQR